MSRLVPISFLIVVSVAPGPPVLGRAGEIALRRRQVLRAPSPAGKRAVTLIYDLGSRSPEALDALVPGPAAPLTLRDDGNRPSTARGEVTTDIDGLILRIEVDGLSPHTRRIARLDGAVRAYPAARRIRFHIPWLKDELPLTSEVSGGTATLTRFQLAGADSTLWIRVRPPEGFRLADPEHPGGLTARAFDIDGNLVNGGGVTEIQRLEAGAAPEFRLHAPGLRRTPSRLTLEVLCVSGQPRAVPFRLRDIPLPTPD